MPPRGSTPPHFCHIYHEIFPTRADQQEGSGSVVSQTQKFTPFGNDLIEHGIIDVSRVVGYILGPKLSTKLVVFSKSSCFFELFWE
jgi:hypothetical protein